MPNHFLLTGNELVADWPEPDHPYLFYTSPSEYANRPRYNCSPELLAMLKEEERYEEGKDFRLQRCNCKIGQDCKYVKGKWLSPCTVAVPVEKGEEANPFTKDYGDINDIIARLKALEAENAALKQQFGKH